jgi:ABC-type nitrate/sulfonate/bicarbonate transport system substrate-binding protein
LAGDGLALAFVEGDTAANTIPKMAAGDIDVGQDDLNALIEHLPQGKTNPPLAVFTSCNASTYTIAVAGGSAIVVPRDLQDKRLLAYLSTNVCAKSPSLLY